MVLFTSVSNKKWVHFSFVITTQYAESPLYCYTTQPYIETHKGDFLSLPVFVTYTLFSNVFFIVIQENQTCPICRLDTKLTCDS